MRAAAALVLVAVLVAGCGDGGSKPDPSPTMTTGASPTTPPAGPTQPHAVPPAFPSTLFLLADGTAAVNGSTQSARQDPSVATGHAAVSWAFTAPAAATIGRLEGDVWIDVPAPFVVPLGIGFSFSTEEGSFSHAVDYHMPPGGVVPPGVQQLSFAADAVGETADRTLSPGEVLRIHLYTNNVYAGTPTPPFTVLSGPDHPTQARLGFS